MVAMKIFTVTAERGTSGVWVLECAELGVVSQTKRLDQAEEEVAEAIAYQSNLTPGDFAIEVVPVLPANIEALRKQAQRCSEDAERAAQRAMAAKRELARSMRDQGFTVREMGEVLGVSFQRAAALAAG